MTVQRRLGVLFPLLLLSSYVFAASDMKPEEVLQKHLDSIGKPQALAGIKSRVVQGQATYKLLVGGSGAIDGKAVFASEGEKSHLLFKVNAQQYKGEQFIWNGSNESIAATYNDKTWSEFGDFLRSQNAPLREGLLGGVLNTTWPLLDLQKRKAKLDYLGNKSVDGRELIALRYKPKKGTDLSITLYFDPETFCHVMTIYSATRAPGMGSVTYNLPGGGQYSTGASEEESARQNESRFRIEERFSDFQTVDGLKLPSHYDLRYTQELQSGFSKSIEWDVKVMEINNNIPLDPRNFEVK